MTSDGSPQLVAGNCGCPSHEVSSHEQRQRAEALIMADEEKKRAATEKAKMS